MIAEDDEAIHAKFGDEVDHHGANQHDVLIPTRLRERLAPPDGERGKHKVVKEDLRHRKRYVFRGLKRKLAVDREVIHNRQRQSDEITQPIAPVKGLVEQRKRNKLNDAR